MVSNLIGGWLSSICVCGLGRCVDIVEGRDDTFAERSDETGAFLL